MERLKQALSSTPRFFWVLVTVLVAFVAAVQMKVFKEAPEGRSAVASAGPSCSIAEDEEDAVFVNCGGSY